MANRAAGGDEPFCLAAASVSASHSIYQGARNASHRQPGCISEFVPDRKKDQCPSSAAIAASWEKLEIGSEPVQALIRDLVARKVAITSTLPVFDAMVATRSS